LSSTKHVATKLKKHVSVHSFILKAIVVYTSLIDIVLKMYSLPVASDLSLSSLTRFVDACHGIRGIVSNSIDKLCDTIFVAPARHLSNRSKVTLVKA